MSAFLISGAILRVVVSAYAATSSNVGIGWLPTWHCAAQVLQRPVDDPAGAVRGPVEGDVVHQHDLVVRGQPQVELEHGRVRRAPVHRGERVLRAVGVTAPRCPTIAGAGPVGGGDGFGRAAFATRPARATRFQTRWLTRPFARRWWRRSKRFTAFTVACR